MARTTTRIGSLALRNPVLAASGTFGFGREMADLCPLEQIGGVVVKSVTVEPRAGNPPPRIAETPSGMINSIGLENPGLQRFLSELLPDLDRLPCAVIVSIAGDRAEEFPALAAALNGPDRVDAIEVNVSCPNQKAGGMSFGADPDAAASVVAAVRAETGKPLIVKLTPAVPDIRPVARAVESAGADAVCAVNTFPALAVDWRARTPRIHGKAGRGGLSGPAVKPMALRFVNDAFNAVAIPVVGCGGIVNAGDALEFIVAGAAAVQVGTANFLDPSATARIARDLSALLDGTAQPDIADWVGTLKI